MAYWSLVKPKYTPINYERKKDRNPSTEARPEDYYYDDAKPSPRQSVSHKRPKSPLYRPLHREESFWDEKRSLEAQNSTTLPARRPEHRLESTFEESVPPNQIIDSVFSSSDSEEWHDPDGSGVASDNEEHVPVAHATPSRNVPESNISWDRSYLERDVQHVRPFVSASIPHEVHTPQLRTINRQHASDGLQSSLFCSMDDLVQPAQHNVPPAAAGHAPEHYGWGKEHIVLEPKNEKLLVTCKFLGKGSIGSVEEVRRRSTQLPTFVRKRVELSPRKRQAKAEWELIHAEAKSLKSLTHAHVVTLIGSYEQHTEYPIRHTYFFLMCPVGDNDMKHFLDEVGEEFEKNPNSAQLPAWKGWLASWFICLSSALAYMHEQGIRHQDIKPSNIIHKDGQIYFTDFSSAGAFEVGHTTSTEKESHTSPMYAAPEIIARYERHGQGSDIFALGGVFCDMLTVMQDRSVESFQESLLGARPGDEVDKHIQSEACQSPSGPKPSHQPPYQGSPRYSHELDAINSWFSGSTFFKSHISPMLDAERKLRQTAEDVFQRLLTNRVDDGVCPCWKARAANFSQATASSEEL
jgi:serine/threonine protein kinase